MYLLDSSAWLAHLLGEPGLDEVNLLFDAANTEVSISALSIPEIYGRLCAMGREAHWQTVWESYRPLFTRIIATDETIAQHAIFLRASTKSRLPTIDGLIAATAAINGMTLVHRDAHLAGIPTALLQQQQLIEK